MAKTDDILPFQEDENRPRIETLAIAEITLDGEIAARDLDPDTVTDYRERLAAGDEFQPLQVMRDDNGVNRLWDGWHRLEAARSNGLESVRCEIRKGDKRAAILASAGANATHGLRRSAEDKRRAVLKLLTDSEWVKWSDREIARRCKVSNTFVGEVRSSLTVNVDSEDDGRPRQYRTKHGNVSTMNTADIGAKQGETNVTHLPSSRKNFSQEDVSEGATTPPDTDLTSVWGPAKVQDVPLDFAEMDMVRLERAAGNARYTRDKTYLRRMKAVVRKLQKAIERLERLARKGARK